jgi:uncharacterized protein YdhG (YjbR/CyaY superfamily)
VTKPSAESAVRDKIAALPAFRDIAALLHEVLIAATPELEPRLWYGMPGYARAAKSPVLCFFRVADDRDVTLGLTEHAHHQPEPDSGHQLMGPAWFLTELDDATEARITDIVRHAVA